MELEETTGGCTLVMRIGVLYIALAYASQEAVYLSDLLSELALPRFSSVQTYEDNMGALELTGTVKGQTHLYEIPFSARAGYI